MINKKKKYLYFIFRINLFLLIIITTFNKSAIAQDSKKSAQLFNKGMMFFRQAKNTEALKAFSDAVEADSSNYDARIKKGFLMGVNGDFEGEIQEYSKIISLSPEHKWGYISRGSAYNRVGKFDLAIIDLTKVIEMDPDNAEAYNNRGFSKKGLGDKDGACNDWNKSKKLGNPEASIILKNNLCK